LQNLISAPQGRNTLPAKQDPSFTCIGHPDGAVATEGPPSFAPLLVEHLAGFIQNYRQNPLSVAEKLDTGPSSFTAFSPQDDNFYLLAFMVNTRNLL
jgi:hypothetical protein